MCRAAKQISLILMSAILAITFCACGYSITLEEAEAKVDGFFAAVSSGNLADACKQMHPERSSNEEEMRKYIESLEEYDEIDFSGGARVSKYIGYTYVQDSDTVGGAIYRLEFKLEIGENTLDAQAEMVKNYAGFGIYNIFIQPPAEKE